MADIVLRDRSGNPVEYPGVERVKLNTTGGGTKEFIDPDTVPKAVEKTIDPDFSSGDMEVIPEDGQVFSKVGISKPTNLLPGNIAEGVDIAGIIGTLASSGGGGGAPIFTKLLSFDGDYEGVTLATKDELAACGIDLTQFNSWYSEGQAYVPIISLSRLLQTAPEAQTKSQVTFAFMTNVPFYIHTSGEKHYSYSRILVSTVADGTSTNVSHGSLFAISSSSKPMAYSLYGTTGLGIRNGDLMFGDRGTKKSLYGTFVLSVILIPTS